MESGNSRKYWWFVAALPIVAWVANTVRVCAVIAMAVGWGPNAARGAMHEIGGWVAVLTVLVGWSLMARWLAAPQTSNQRHSTTSPMFPITA